MARSLLVWQSTSIYVCEGTLKSDEYIKECLEKRLLKLYREHDVPPVFWPDLATIHYSRAAMAWYASSNVDVVPKNMNPPNTPELRNIEKYWALLKREVKKRCSAAENLKSFKEKVSRAAKAIGPSGVQSLMSSVQSRVRKFVRGDDLK